MRQVNYLQINVGALHRMVAEQAERMTETNTRHFDQLYRANVRTPHPFRAHQRRAVRVHNHKAGSR